MTPEGYCDSHALMFVALHESSAVHAPLSAHAVPAWQQLATMHGAHCWFDVASDPLDVFAPQLVAEASPAVASLVPPPLLPLEAPPPPEPPVQLAAPS